MFLLHLNLDSKIPLPMLESVQIETLGSCVLTSSPTSPDCMVISVLKKQKVLLHCRPKDQSWTKVILPLIQEDFNGDFVIWKGNLYAFLSPYSFVAFTTLNSLATGSASWSRVRLNPPFNTFHNMKIDKIQTVQHIVASGEDLLLVLVSFHLRAVMDVGVFSLQIDERGHSIWKREKGPNRCKFFLGGKNVSFTINHDNLQHDFMYLLRPSDDEANFDGEELLYKIDMDDQMFILALIPHEVIMDHVWILPPRTRRVKKENGASSHMITSIEEEENPSDISTWADMPPELLGLILSGLSLVERIYVRTVCKPWSKVPNPLQNAKVWPWLMYRPKGTGQCRFIDPLYGKVYSMDLRFLGFDSALHSDSKNPFFDPDKIILHFSKDGWVLLSDEDGVRLSIINPFTRKKIITPPARSERISFSFSSVPTSPVF